MFIMSLRSQYTGNPSRKNQAKMEAVIIFVTIAGMLVTFLIGYWFGSEVTEEKHPWSISSAGVYSENHSGNDRVAKVKSGDRIVIGQHECTATFGEAVGHMYTAAHCFADNESTVRDGAGHKLGTLAAIDRVADTAVIRLTHGITAEYAKVNESAELHKGDRTVIKGAAAGRLVTGSITDGPDENFMYTTADGVGPGDSGGPVYDEDGELVGIVSQKVNYEIWNGSIVGFAPIEQAVMLHANLP